MVAEVNPTGGDGWHGFWMTRSENHSHSFCHGLGAIEAERAQLCIEFDGEDLPRSMCELQIQSFEGICLNINGRETYESKRKLLGPKPLLLVLTARSGAVVFPPRNLHLSGVESAVSDHLD